MVGMASQAGVANESTEKGFVGTGTAQTRLRYYSGTLQSRARWNATDTHSNSATSTATSAYSDELVLNCIEVLHAPSR